MKTNTQQWFEVTIRYYNPAHPQDKITETIAIRAESFSDAENKVGDLYRPFRNRQILSITPAIYDDVILTQTYSDDKTHWFLVELQEDQSDLEEYYQYLREAGCDCRFLTCCSHSNPTCISVRRGAYDLYDDNCPIGFDEDYCDCADFEGYGHKSGFDSLGFRTSRNGNVHGERRSQLPMCFHYADDSFHKMYLLAQGRDFTHVLQRVKEYVNNCILNYHILAIVRTGLYDVITEPVCQN